MIIGDRWVPEENLLGSRRRLSGDRDDPIRGGYRII